MPATYDVCRYMLLPGDLIQIDPDHDAFLGGCVLFVDELQPNFVYCHVATPQGALPYRVPYEKFTVIGPPCFIPSTLSEQRSAAYAANQKAQREGVITYLYAGSSTPLPDIEPVNDDASTIDSDGA